ncbi:MAG: 50S ribosomal protein L23 [Candidatus Andersenbacteria bacterium]
MAWFWQRKKQEKEQRDAQQQARGTKRGLFGRVQKPAATTAVVSKATAKKAPARGKKSQSGETHSYGILLGPIVTEKAARLAESGTFVFAVTPKANKIEIARAVAALYSVHPQHVSVVNAHGKPKNFALRSGYRADQRKAYVTLAKGEHIEFFESER